MLYPVDGYGISFCFLLGTLEDIKNEREEAFNPPTPPASSGSDSSTPAMVPVSNDDNSVDVKATVSGKDATIKPLDSEQIEQLVGDENASGDVVIDLSNIGKTIDTAGIPKATLEAIVEAAEDAGNDTEHLAIKLSTAELKLDDAAMRAIVDQAKGDIIKFNFDDVGLKRLNKEQKNAVKDMDVRKGLRLTSLSTVIVCLTSRVAMLRSPFLTPCSSARVCPASPAGTSTRKAIPKS